jgi:hypothetical protein
MMDKAINIGDLRKQNIKNYNDNIYEEFQKKIKTLHRNHFERMMPSE